MADTKAATSYVIGLGNFHMSDDAIGIRMIEHLSQHLNHPHTQLLELGGRSLDLLHYFEPGTAKILLIDAAHMGLSAGQATVFSPDEAKSLKYLKNYSTHEGDLFFVIELAEKLGYFLPPIKILGIEPQNMTSGMELSDELKGNLPFYTKLVQDEMDADWLKAN